MTSDRRCDEGRSRTGVSGARGIMSVLIECGGCRRFVRMTEVRCPFCRVAMSGERARPRARIVGVVTRAALFYGASSLAGCSEPPTPPAAEAVQTAPVEPMMPTAEEEAPAEAAYAIGPVEIEPEPSDVADAERADAEGAKHEQDRVVRREVVRHRQVQVQQVQQVRDDRVDLRDEMIHSAPPYGAPPVDAPV